jgi:hypothetical protein
MKQKSVEFIGKTLPGKGRKGSTKEFVERIKERPGEWAVFAEKDKAWTAHFSYRRNYPGTDWAVRRDKSKWIVYGRYVGKTIILTDLF